jgi:hypothetical protein
MNATDSTEPLVREVLRGLLRELLDGPPGDFAFIVNPGDPGLARSLATLSAADASARPGGRSSVAAHTQHLRYGFSLLNRWIRGDDQAFADATYAASWGPQQVTDQEWQALRDELAREVQAWSAAFEAPRDWNALTLSGALSSVAHLAYHLGAIRQLCARAGGPAARD